MNSNPPNKILETPDEFLNFTWEGSADPKEFITCPVVTEIKSKKCDCGGFKTFGTMSPEAHSHWCSSL